MAFFKMRKGGDESLSTPSQPESIEAMRRRARHRLIGAVVLVLLGVVGFPLLFDTQPRPIAVDIPIDIPDRNKVKPLAPPAARPVAQSASAGGAVTAPVMPEPEVKVAAAPAEPVTRPEPKPDPKPEAKPEPKPEPEAKVARAEPKPEPKPAPAAGDGAKARALLEGKPVEPAGPAAADGRFVVQVGAFADPVKARETRLKVEKTGMKTYTHVAETKDGKRIRVRVGPFPTRAEADKAAELIKGLELPAAVLTL